jgi:hypothetical protein
MKFASIIAALAVVLATPAAAQPLERQHYLDREHVLDPLQSPAVALLDGAIFDS